MRKIPPICILLLAIVIVSSPQNLFIYWSEAPAERLGWLAATIWSCSLLVVCWMTQRGRQVDRKQLALVSLIALAASLASDLNFLRHVAVAASIVGLINPKLGKWIATLTCVTWLPVTDVLVDHSSGLITVLRILCSGGVLWVLAGRSCETAEDQLRRVPISLNIALAIAASVCLVAGLLASFRSASSPSIDLTALASTGPGYVAKRMELDPVERLALGGGKAARYYVVSGDHRFLLTLIDAAGQAHAIHHPSVCHGGRGWRTEVEQKISNVRGDVGLLHLRRGNERKQILYWFACGPSRHASFVRNRMDDIMQRLSLRQESPRCFVMVDLLSEMQRPDDLVASCRIFELL